MFRKIALSAAVLLSFAAGTANATVFGGSAAFVDLTSGNPLTVTANPNPRTFATSNITAGGSSYFAGFMTLTTTDTQGGFACILGCTSIDQVSLTFTWTSPSGAAASPFGGAVTQTDFLIASLDNGSLVWANSNNIDSNFNRYATQQVTFADGAIANVDVYNSLLTGTTSSLGAQFDVRIRDVRDPTNVPEPMSLALLGSSLLGLGVIRKVRKQK